MTLALVAAASRAIAQSDAPSDGEQLQQLLERVPLPEAYTASIQRYIDDDDEPDQELKVWSGPAWSVALQSLAQPGVGFIPYDYSHATPQESWRYHFDSQRAERNDHFQTRHTTAFERDSPFGLVRQLRAMRPGVDSIKTEGGLTIATIVPPGPPTPARRVLEFESKTGFLVRVTNVMSGRVNSETRFEDWRELPSGAFLPHRAWFSSVDLRDDRTDTDHSVLTAVKEVDPSAPPDRLPIAPGFTIIDQIESVTKRSDGSVLGPIGQGDPTGAVTSGRAPGATSLSSRSVMLIGVALILLAGIVFGVKRWKGA